MSVRPDTLKVGQCYLMRSGHVRRVVAIADERVRYETRSRLSSGWAWHPSIVPLTVFASLAERPVPCGWTPEVDRP